jgi:hypothetical protein
MIYTMDRVHKLQDHGATLFSESRCTGVSTTARCCPGRLPSAFCSPSCHPPPTEYYSRGFNKSKPASENKETQESIQRQEPNERPIRVSWGTRSPFSTAFGFSYNHPNRDVTSLTV